MPSKDWLKDNPKVSTYIPHHLYNKLLSFMADQGINSTAKALKLILEQHLSSQPESKVDHLVDYRLKAVEQKISEISQLLAELTTTTTNKNSRLLVNNSVDNSPSESSQLVDHSRQLSTSGDWLTTGEAYAEIQQRGYSKSIGTFRRSLSDGTIPAELEKLGLVADWSIRNQANPKDNSVKWLRVN